MVSASGESHGVSSRLATLRFCDLAKSEVALYRLFDQGDREGTGVGQARDFRSLSQNRPARTSLLPNGGALPGHGLSDT
jgi:hypothetical protein